MRKTVKIEENITKAIQELLNGSILEIPNGDLSRKICWRFQSLRKNGHLGKAYDYDKRCTILWLRSERSKNILKNALEKKKGIKRRQKKFSLLENIREFVFGG